MSKPTKRYKMISVEKEDFEIFDQFAQEKKRKKVSLFSIMLQFFIDNYDVATLKKKTRSGKLNLTKDEREIQKMIRKEISVVISFIRTQDKFMKIYRNEILWKIDPVDDSIVHPLEMHYVIIYEFLLIVIENLGVEKNEIDVWIKNNISVIDAIQFQESVEITDTMKIFK